MSNSEQWNLFIRPILGFSEVVFKQLNKAMNTSNPSNKAQNHVAHAVYHISQSLKHESQLKEVTPYINFEELVEELRNVKNPATKKQIIIALENLTAPTFPLR